MKLFRSWMALVAVVCVQTAVAETYDLRAGTIEVSPDFVLKKGGTDSVLGTLTRKADGFVISFDVGAMAGVHMHAGKKATCTFYREHHVGGQPATTGIEPVAGGRRITTTVFDSAAPRRAPANFWADIRQESDIAEFLLIVASYQPKRTAAP